MPPLRALLPLVLLLPFPVAADDPPVDEPAWRELVVTPRAVSEQLLEVELFPNDAERIEGNAVPILLRLTWEQQPTLLATLDKAADHLELPMGEFSAAKLREEVPLVRFSELRRAAYRTDAEWEYPLRETKDLHYILLPDLQGMRTFTRMLAAHARADIADGEVDEAIEKIRVGFGVSDHLGRTPFLIVKLVQTVTQAAILDRVEELAQLEAAPNLYWGLARLPRPLSSLGHVADWEAFALNSIPELNDLDEPRTPEQWQALGKRLFELQRDLATGWDELVERHGGAAKMRADFLKRARERLPVVAPQVAARVPEMSDDEVGVRYFAARVLVESDRAASILLLPPAEGLPLVADLDKRRAEWREHEPELEAVVGNFTLATARIWAADRRVAALRVVEALRDHAARHEGRLPESLADIEGLPIPVDPFTNEPFGYVVVEGVASLTGDAVPGAAKGHDRIGYRIRIRP